MARINQLLTDIENKIDKIEEILSFKNLHLPISTKRCRVKGCTICKSNKPHFCKICKNTNSTHFSSKCPFSINKFIEDNAKNITKIDLDGFNGIISRKDVLIILCHVYIVSANNDGTFPFGDEKYKHFNFTHWFTNREKSYYSAKIDCIVNYFKIMHILSIKTPSNYEEILSQNITITKKKTQKLSGKNLKGNLSNFSITDIPIEQQSDCIQADFANKNIGGGVLRGGCVQEEIRFVISPECLIAVLFYGKIKMEYNEAICIEGTNIFSNYSGYSDSFKFNGPNNTINFDKPDTIVAFDAQDYSKHNTNLQYIDIHINREINKCIVAFDKWNTNDNASFATGNWGCGAFKGDPQLKLIIQWIAASIVGRNLTYNAYGDIRLLDIPASVHLSNLHDVIQRIKQKYPTISDLYTNCIEICKTENKKNLIRELIKK